MRQLGPFSFALSALVLAPITACETGTNCDVPDCLSADASETATGEGGEGGDGDGDPSGETATGDGDGDAALLDSCAGDDPIVVLETSLGTMVVQLDAVRAPVTVTNFATYVEAGFYDNTIIHRVINNFVIQGGGYEPGLVLKPTMGTIPLEIHPELRHVDGAIAMARSQNPDTAESQWYITDGAQPNLDDDYAVFGVIIDGFDVRNAISSVETTTVPFMDLEFTNVPAQDVIVNAAYCVEVWP